MAAGILTSTITALVSPRTCTKFAVAAASAPNRVSFSLKPPPLPLPLYSSLRLSNSSFFLPFASAGGDSINTDTIQDSETVQDSESIDDSEIIEDNVDSPTDSDPDDEIPSSAVIEALSSYRQALASNDEATLVQTEAFIKSVEDDKNHLAIKVLTLSEQLSTEKTRLLRISADFDNFRKRTEREKLSLVTNAQGQLLESLLSVLDNFERAKSQIKVETEAEQKIVNSYQSIYKQFTEILASLGVLPVETVGKPFDPLLHEAIMREDSAEYEEGVVLEEFRKGFQLGDRLLRPSMVKVSSGPGPDKSESAEQQPEAVDDDEGVTKIGEDGSADEPKI